MQKLVSAASINFNTAIISELAEDGFKLSLNGSLTGTGPLDALIEYVEPVVVNWQGVDIATLTLPAGEFSLTRGSASTRAHYYHVKSVLLQTLALLNTKRMHSCRSRTTIRMSSIRIRSIVAHILTQ